MDRHRMAWNTTHRRWQRLAKALGQVLAKPEAKP